MTTGLINEGSGFTSSWHYRNWNGADGKYIGSGEDRVVKWNNYTSVEIKQEAGPGNAGYFPNITGKYLDFYKDHDIASLSNVIGRAQSDLINQINGHNFNLGIAVGEGKRTVSMVRDTLGRLGLTALDLRRGNFKDAANRLSVGGTGFKNNFRKAKLEDVSNAWLELQYGWRPLINDCYEAAKAFEKGSSSERKMVYMGRAGDQIQFNSAWIPSRYDAQHLVKRRVYLVAELSEDFDFSPRRALGLEDPSLVAWELVPWSFVVDWFVPIGTYLGNLQNMPRLKGRYRRTIRYRGKCEAVIKNIPYNHDYDGAWAKGEYNYISRTCDPSVLEVIPPRFKPLSEALSPMHIANAIALAHSRFSGFENKIDRPRLTKSAVNSFRRT